MKTLEEFKIITKNFQKIGPLRVRRVGLKFLAAVFAMALSIDPISLEIKSGLRWLSNWNRKTKSPENRDSLPWTRRGLHPLSCLSKAEFYYINYGPKVHSNKLKQKKSFCKDLFRDKQGPAIHADSAFAKIITNHSTICQGPLSTSQKT